MIDGEERVSGNIFAHQGPCLNDKECYFIKTKSGQKWGVPVCNINPEDLRALADRIEFARADKDR